MKNKTISILSVVITLLSSNAFAYLSSDGDEFTITYNSHGAILTSISKKHYAENNASGIVHSKHLKLYLGKDCDAFSNVYGKGTWEWANGGFVIHYSGKDFGFPRQEVNIPGMDKCQSN